MKYYLTLWFSDGKSPVEWELPSYDACLTYLMSREFRSYKNVQLYQIEKHEEDSKNARSVIVLNDPIV